MENVHELESLNTTQAFATRLSDLLDGHPNCPPAHGRKTWLMRALSEHGVNVSLETVRKWMAGESMPRRDKLAKLAEAMRVDAAWLAMGSQPVSDVSGSMRIIELENVLLRILAVTDDAKITAMIRKVLELDQSGKNVG